MRATMNSRADAARATGEVAPSLSNSSATFFDRGPTYSAPTSTDTSQSPIAIEIHVWPNYQRDAVRITPAMKTTTETGRK